LLLRSYKLFVGVSSVLSLAGKVSTNNDIVRQLLLLLKLFNVRIPPPEPLLIRLLLPLILKEGACAASMLSV
jgi:hypothetical protein